MAGTKNSAAKVKAYRARQRAGLAVLKVPVPSYDVVQALIESGRLTVAEALDRQRVEHAVAEVVVEWTAPWKKV
jgi:hypothetical protein